MKKRIKAAWLKALRSGEYDQGNFFLKKDGQFCCLGVLCDIQGICWSAHRMENRDRPWVPDKYSAGLKLTEQRFLARMNDRSATFSQIADYIEKNL